MKAAESPGWPEGSRKVPDGPKKPWMTPARMTPDPRCSGISAFRWMPLLWRVSGRVGVRPRIEEVNAGWVAIWCQVCMAGAYKAAKIGVKCRSMSGLYGWALRFRRSCFDEARRCLPGNLPGKRNPRSKACSGKDAVDGANPSFGNREWVEGRAIQS